VVLFTLNAILCSGIYTERNVSNRSQIAQYLYKVKELSDVPWAEKWSTWRKITRRLRNEIQKRLRRTIKYLWRLRDKLKQSRAEQTARKLTSRKWVHHTTVWGYLVKVNKLQEVGAWTHSGAKTRLSPTWKATNHED